MTLKRKQSKEIPINVALAEADGPTNTGFDSHKSHRACCASIYTDIELEMRTDNFIYLVPVSFPISGRRRRVDLIYFADEKKYVFHAMTNAIATPKALNYIARVHLQQSRNFRGMSSIMLDQE
ncbi:uncharacterized protein RCO7_14095 [Rhynchosporium graminicola]|uniref:Uncharacterized protein n=1 Tax=Rhynchosporium graminicola TaxID=2792576 RepID=A0A1E1JVB6_9HELO|nr:uncharacterized protein RCO7_14095 [Rhynchosporium commune]